MKISKLEIAFVILVACALIYTLHGAYDCARQRGAFVQGQCLERGQH